MKNSIKWLAAFLVAVGFNLMVGGALAQDIQPITGTQVEYSAGQQLTIIATLAEGLDVQEVMVFLRSQSDTHTISGSAILEPGRAVYALDLLQQPLKAFTTVEYRFTVKLADGTTFDSQAFSFYYDDNRFTWKTRQDGPFRVHWYEGDDAFAQMVLDVANSGQQTARSFISYPELDQVVDIYVYASGADLNSLSQFYGPVMVIGHADPPLGLMTVLIPTGPEQWMAAKKVVPHELVHILLYRKVGQRYAKLPTWLNEGLASLNEVADPNFFTYLQEASQTGTLIPMSQLCNGFPQEGNNYILSYAQSFYFVRYLYQTYGSVKLEELIGQYADGIACEIAPQSILGFGLDQLDTGWREKEFQKINPQVKTFSPVLPWVVVAVVAFAGPGILILLAAFRSVSQK